MKERGLYPSTSALGGAISCLAAWKDDFPWIHAWVNTIRTSQKALMRKFRCLMFWHPSMLRVQFINKDNPHYITVQCNWWKHRTVHVDSSTSSLLFHLTLRYIFMTFPGSRLESSSFFTTHLSLFILFFCKIWHKSHPISTLFPDQHHPNEHVLALDADLWTIFY